MLKNKKDMSKTQPIAKYGGNRMYFAPQCDYDNVIKRIPRGTLLTVRQIRECFTKKNYAAFTDPMTAGIFVTVVARASYQRNDNVARFAHVKIGRRMKRKISRSRFSAKKLLEEEGHVFVCKCAKYYENSLMTL